MSCEIVKAEIADAEEILALQKLCFKSEAELYNDYGIEPLTQTVDELREDFDTYLFLKAIDCGRIIGSVKGRMTDERSCWIGRLMVHPEYQGRGIGKTLLREIELRFPAARKYTLGTGHKSLKNIALYDKAGYRAVRQERISDSLSFVIMEKPSSAAAG
jgi:ribosomal protein S18 acetylase RimI-like enzyme